VRGAPVIAGARLCRAPHASAIDDRDCGRHRPAPLTFRAVKPARIGGNRLGRTAVIADDSQGHRRCMHEVHRVTSARSRGAVRDADRMPSRRVSRTDDDLICDRSAAGGAGGHGFSRGRNASR
jgi:hypothetical protein